MKTDNSHFEEKVLLRIYAIKDIISPSVLECYSGTGKLWDEVKKRTGKEITILRIEKEKSKGNKIYLQGDNIKFLLSLNLDKFDVIDLDAYGIPYDQINLLYNRDYKGTVIVTAIQSMQGGLPHKMLMKLGFTKQMIQKIPSLFFRNGFGKLKNYLYLSGVQSIEGYFIDRKNYFMFKF